MAIAKVNITEQNGQLGGLLTTTDGVSGLVISGVATTANEDVLETTLNEPFRVFGMSDSKLTDHDITSGGLNGYAYKVIEEFYKAAGEGAELWVVLTSDGHDNLFSDERAADKIIEASNGRIRILGVTIEYSTGEGNGVEDDTENTTGISDTVGDSISIANDFAKERTQGMKPVVVILDGKGFTPASLDDLTEGSSTFVQVIIGSLNFGEKNAAVGFAVGYTATLPVQRKKSRVKNGALPISEAHFTLGVPTEALKLAWPTISESGYLFFITREGKSGYYFSSDETASNKDNDYHDLPKRRVVNKAIELAYAVFVEHLDDEVPVSEGGTIDPAYAAYLEGLMDNQLNQIMVASGEASGARTTVDTSSDILSKNTTNVSIEIQPVGYNETISVTVGFTKQLN